MKELFILSLISLLLSLSSNAATLKVKIWNIPNSSGVLRLFLCNNKYCYDEEENYLRKIIIPAKQNKLFIAIRHLRPGTYSLSGYHDENNNNKLDSSFFGFPLEHFAISRINKAPYSKPKWKKVKFRIQRGNNYFNLKMLIH